CIASSRVGARISAYGPLPGFRCDSCRRWRIGSEKAAVFPVPVAAWPRTSLPAMRAGIVSVWIGVGSSYPSAVSAETIAGSNPRAANPDSLDSPNSPDCDVSSSATGSPDLPDWPDCPGSAVFVLVERVGIVQSKPAISTPAVDCQQRQRILKPHASIRHTDFLAPAGTRVAVSCDPFSAIRDRQDRGPAWESRLSHRPLRPEPTREDCGADVPHHDDPGDAVRIAERHRLSAGRVPAQSRGGVLRSGTVRCVAVRAVLRAAGGQGLRRGGGAGAVLPAGAGGDVVAGNVAFSNYLIL